MQEIKKVMVKVPQAYLDFINQIFDIEKKAANLKEENSIQRNTNKLKSLIDEGIFQGNSFTFHNPLGEKYDETRGDCDADIAGSTVENLKIVEVIKPIIFYTYQENEKTLKVIAQRALVLVESSNNN